MDDLSGYCHISLVCRKSFSFWMLVWDRRDPSQAYAPQQCAPVAGGFELSGGRQIAARQLPGRSNGDESAGRRGRAVD